MTALPISPHSLNNVSRFAHEIWQSCRTAKTQFEAVGREVFAMKTVVELVALELEDKTLPVNQLDEDGTTRTHYRQLGIHIGNCQQALQAVHDCLRRQEKLATWQQLRWGWSGREDLDGLIANVVSFTTQLDSFAGALNMKAMGKTLARIGRIEQLLDQNERNEAAAVTILMADLASTGMPSQNIERYRAVLTGYAQEASKVAITTQGSGKKSKADSSEGRKLSDAALIGTRLRPQERSQSADTISTTTSTSIERSKSANPTGKQNISDNKSNHDTRSKKSGSTDPPPLLECWLIQVKTGNFTFLAWQKSGKEPQPRGQAQLHAMARNFRAWQASSGRSGTTDEYDLVGWVIEDRQKSEPDQSTYIWRPYAFKLERKTPPLQPLLDAGVEEQALVIISRHLSPSGIAAQSEARKLAQAQEATQQQIAKRTLAARKSEDAAVERAERQSRERAKRQAEARHLQSQVAMLGLNQQPTLADKPEAIAEKRRAEKRAREEGERKRAREMEERKANVGKVRLALWGMGGKAKEDKRLMSTAMPFLLSPSSPSSHSPISPTTITTPRTPRTPPTPTWLDKGKWVDPASRRLCRDDGGGMMSMSVSSDITSSKMFVPAGSFPCTRLETVVE